MPNLATWLAFVATALVLLLIPGPAVLYIVSQSVEHGRRAGLMATLGVHCGTLVHITAAALGLSAILVSSSLAFGAVRLIGAAYLIYLGVRILADRTARTQAPAPRETRLGLIFRQGILVNVTNPKTALFFFAFLPQFVPARGGHQMPAMLALSGVFMAMTFVVFAGYGVFAAAARRHLIDRPRVVRRIRQAFAASFVALGAKLATTAR
jgi:threonine/homoserine/homoserine lactone efflux protein